MSGLDDVYTEWQNNNEFKEAFKKNPRLALEKWGFVLDEKELKMILKINKENQELDKRVNK